MADSNVTILKELRKKRFFLELIKNTSSCCLVWVRIDNNQYKSSKDNFEFFLTSNNSDIVLDVHKDCRYATSYRASDENSEITDLYNTIVLIQDKQFDIVAQEEKNLIELLRWCRCTNTWDEYVDGGVVIGGTAEVYQPQRIFEIMDGGVVVNGTASERQAERFFEIMDGGVVVNGTADSGLTINPDTYIYIYFDASGSMNSSLIPLREMRDTLLKNALLPFYGNDSTAYDNHVTIIEDGTERTFYMANNANNVYPDDAANVVVMVFQDESNTYGFGQGAAWVCSGPTSTFIQDMSLLRNTIGSFSENFYRSVIFQVEPYIGFKGLIEAVQHGSASPGDCAAYDPPNGLSDRGEFVYKYDITDGGTPEYYLEEVLSALEELGFEVR